MTVTSRLHRQKDKGRQRKTEENVDRRPVVAPGAGVRWRGSSTGAPGAGLRIAVAKDLRGQGSRLSTGLERRWVLLKIPRGDIDELGEEQ